jgi:esterase/lipase
LFCGYLEGLHKLDYPLFLAFSAGIHHGVIIPISSFATRAFMYNKPMKKYLLLLLVFAFLASGGQADETQSKTWDPLIETSDGFKLRCTFYQPHKEALNIDSKAVILVHMLGGKKTDWNNLPKKLSKAGFSVLILELRGHSHRVANHLSWKNYEKKQYENMVNDIKAGKKWLKNRRTVHVDKIALCGARFGSVLSLLAMKEDKELLAALCLSAGESYRGLKVDYALNGRNGRPVKLITAEEDIYASECLKKFKEEGKVETELLSKNDSRKDIGTDLLQSRKGLEDEIVTWFKKNF